MHRAAPRAPIPIRFPEPQCARQALRGYLACWVHALPIQSFQKRRQLRGRQPHDTILHARPAELAILQPFGEQTYAGAVPIDQLHPVSSFRPEHIDRTRERIGLHPFAYQYRQSLGAFAEVDWPRRHQHPNRTRRTNHAPAFKARSTAATVFASAPRPIQIVTPSISTSMLPQLRLAWPVRLRCRPRSTSDGIAVSTTAGTNSGARLSLRADGWRACRRHVKTCCGVSP